MDCSTPGFPVLHYFPELLKFMSVEFAMLSNHLILSYLLLLLPSIFPSVKVFSTESPLCIRWPKYWSFGFSFSPFNEYSGSIYFRIDWFDLLTEKNLSVGLSQLWITRWHFLVSSGSFCGSVTDSTKIGAFHIVMLQCSHICPPNFTHSLYGNTFHYFQKVSFTWISTHKVTGAIQT